MIETILMSPWTPWLAFLFFPLGLLAAVLCLLYIGQWWKDRPATKELSLRERVTALEKNQKAWFLNLREVKKNLDEVGAARHDNLQQHIKNLEVCMYTLRNDVNISLVEKLTLEKELAAEKAKTHRFDLEVD